MWVQGDQRGFSGGEQLVRLRPLDGIAENHPARRQVSHPAADPNHVIIARGLAVANVHVGHGEIRALLLQLLIRHAAFPEMFRPRHIHPDEIVGVVDEAHLIGFGVIHAVVDRVDHRRR